MGKGMVKSSRYAWAIVAACIAFYAIPSGLIGNTCGIFVTPVMEQFGWSRTDATLYMTIQPLVAAVCTPFAGRVLNTRDPRWILTGICLVFSLTSAACAFFDQPWQWHVYGVVYGACTAFYLFLAVPTLINKWFAKRTGTVLGFTAAFLSVFTALATPVEQAVIDMFGWQAARIAAGLASAVVGAGLTALLLRDAPEKYGVAPYGADDAFRHEPRRTPGAAGDAGASGAIDANAPYASGGTGAAGVADAADDATIESAAGAPVASAVPDQGATVSRALRSPAFFLLLLAAGAFCFCTTFVQQISSYCAEGPYGAALGATAVSAAMVASMGSKFVLGWICDRFGAGSAGVFASACGAAGLALALAAQGSIALFLAGAALFGVGYSAVTVVTPMLGSQAFGAAHFSQIYSWISTFIFLGMAAAAFVYAQIYDRTGGFEAAFLVAIALFAVAAAACPLARRIGRGLWARPMRR